MASMQEKLDAIWAQNRGLVRGRLATLERASEELSETRGLSNQLRTEATSEAHKLAGSLGMFGHHEATELARSIELDLENPGLPQPERLRQHVQRLKDTLASALDEN